MANKNAQFRTHYLTKELAYESTQQSGQVTMDTQMISKKCVELFGKVNHYTSNGPRPESATFFARHNGSTDKTLCCTACIHATLTRLARTPCDSCEFYRHSAMLHGWHARPLTLQTHNDSITVRVRRTHHDAIINTANFNFMLPKRRFWNEEQKMKCGFSKHFSRT